PSPHCAGAAADSVCSLPPYEGGLGRGVASRSTLAANALPQSQAVSLRSLRGLDFDRANAGAAEAVGAIHVLDIGLWEHVFAGRYRAHHVGDGEYRLVAARAVERRGEAVVAEFGVRRVLGILDPRQRAGIPGR